MSDPTEVGFSVLVLVPVVEGNDLARALAERTGAGELIVSAMIHGQRDRPRS